MKEEYTKREKEGKKGNKSDVAKSYRRDRELKGGH